MNVIGKYRNGNYYVIMLSDGTKIRETEADEFIPAFAENCDMKITDKCDGNCAFCYEGCTSAGRHGDIMNYKFLETLHPYTELAINGNDLSHPDLVPFMYKMREKRVILNMTVNQIHFERHFKTIKKWVDEGLIHGLGVSLKEPTIEFIDKISLFPNAVIHVINGIVSVSDLAHLADYGLKLLILGYKHLRRGESYYEQNDESVTALQNELSKRLFSEIINDGWFKVVSFDNLAIRQLKVQEQLPEEQWEEFYMGDDGHYTFYIDLVEGTFGKNSLATERFNIMDNIDDMFEKIKQNNY